MKALILIEFWVTVLAGVSFLALFARGDGGLRSEHPGVRSVSRHLVAATAVVVIEVAGLGLLPILDIPIWFFAAVFGAGAAVMVHRNVLLLMARRRARGGD